MYSLLKVVVKMVNRKYYIGICFFPLNLEIESDFDKANSSTVEDIVKTDLQQFVDDSDRESLKNSLLIKDI